MRASKEQAALAAKHLQSLKETYRAAQDYRIQFLEEFLDAAHKKLPTEAAYNRAVMSKKHAKAK